MNLDDEVTEDDSEDTAEDSELEDGFDPSTPPEFDPNSNTFAVLDSSLPPPDQFPEPHHLASYASARRRTATADNREQKTRRLKWHYGIRSQSPPMEVMLEIYRTLKALGMEWKEKGDLGGLGGIQSRRYSGGEGRKVERNPALDGDDYTGVDLKAASDVYFIEARARVQSIVVCTFFLSVPLSPSPLSQHWMTNVENRDGRTCTDPYKHPTVHDRLDELPR
jgi:carbon catabolite-derepressing protein kinase